MFFIIIMGFSLLFSVLSVQKNRGQILEKPDWKLIPTLTAHVIFFLLSFLYCINQFFITNAVAPPTVWAFVFPWLSPLVPAVIVILYKYIYPKYRAKKSKSDSDSSNSKSSSESDELRMDEKYQQELFGYLKYTFIFFARIFIIFIATVLIVLYILSHDPLQQNILPSYLLQQYDTFIQHGLFITFYISLVGSIVTLDLLISTLTLQHQNRQKNRISQLKTYLEANSAKN